MLNCFPIYHGKVSISIPSISTNHNTHLAIMVYEYSKFSTSSLRAREYKVYMQVLHQNILSTLLVYESENMRALSGASISAPHLRTSSSVTGPTPHTVAKKSSSCRCPASIKAMLLLA